MAYTKIVIPVPDDIAQLEFEQLIGTKLEIHARDVNFTPDFYNKHRTQIGGIIIRGRLRVIERAIL